MKSQSVAFQIKATEQSLNPVVLLLHCTKCLILTINLEFVDESLKHDDCNKC